MSGLVCKLCGEIIVRPKEAWREQTGWVSPVGAKAMTGAHPTGELAHDHCVVALREHVNVGQQKLEVPHA